MSFSSFEDGGTHMHGPSTYGTRKLAGQTRTAHRLLSEFTVDVDKGALLSSHADDDET
jgi:hypothetical protein